MLAIARLCFAIILLISANSDAARILAIFPTPSISHQVVFRPLTHELAKRGHEVIILTTDPALPKGEAPKNITEIDMHDMSYKMWREHFHTQSVGNPADIYNQMKAIFTTMNVLMEQQFQLDKVQELVKDKINKFDLLIFEAYAKQPLVFSHIFKAPVIQISSFGSYFWNYNAFGAPIHEILYPTVMRQKLNNLTMYEKVAELYRVYKLQYMFDSMEEEEYAMVKRVFGDDIPPLNELANNLDMLFLNAHPAWEGSRPVPPNIIHINGIHQKEKKPLPQDLKSYLDSSKHGVIYISFGTNVNPSTLPPERMNILINTFSKLPYDVLWKWDQDVMPRKPNNVKLGRWFPQSDLLGHPKVKLFITQGGLQSTDEAINAGVPLIGIPMLVDQWYNVEKYLEHKVGLRLDLETFTEESLKNAVETIINDDSYRRNVIRMRTLMQDDYQSPLERAVWWTEYVIRHGGAKHLRAPSANISWRQYLELDLIFIILSTVLVVVITSVMILLRLCKSLSQNHVGANKRK